MDFIIECIVICLKGSLGMVILFISLMIILTIIGLIHKLIIGE